jgi:hypothetical protein
VAILIKRNKAAAFFLLSLQSVAALLPEKTAAIIPHL